MVSVEVHPSTLPQAGLGLFASRQFAEGERVCRYFGPLLSVQEFLKLQDKSFAMRLEKRDLTQCRDIPLSAGAGKVVYVDAAPECEARWINDCRSQEGYNVAFLKRPESGDALVIALREIQAGEELFVDYGKRYWTAWTAVHKKKPARLSCVPRFETRGEN